ncbi:MAG: YkgJ family cysteine cluster protein [Proteobacteria bacterium]|nr:YkgJ family cysteine cluster protein [Pseudomonadota bacterium]MBU4297481.1 YkgJ family cysteine cluster protein [Pseudomonadota bacterium]MCG2749251.1 YkgJ family cysteine cluster protein [Desulfobulbaceae bacterium]
MIKGKKEMVDRDFLQEYCDLVGRIDGEIKKTAELHGGRLQCEPGCSQCCTISSVLPLEAELLRQALVLLDEQVKKKMHAQAAGSPCPLLVDRLCVVYQSRPIICRTHGLPIAYVDDERQAIEVSACPLNFADEYDFDQQELFFIDPFNTELVTLNEEYCTVRGINSMMRVPMQNLLD